MAEIQATHCRLPPITIFRAYLWNEPCYHTNKHSNFIQVKIVKLSPSVANFCQLVRYMYFLELWSVSLFIFFLDTCLSFQIQILIWKHKAVKDLQFLFHKATLASRNLSPQSFLQGNESTKCDQMWPARFNFPGRLYKSHKLVCELLSFLSLFYGILEKNSLRGTGGRA